jgi:hypothetical protein
VIGVSIGTSSATYRARALINHVRREEAVPRIRPSRRCIRRAALAACSRRPHARLAAKAFLQFPRDWDFLAYHLPGALAAYGL